MAQKKKRTRRRHEPGLKEQAVARAQVVGVTAAAREFNVVGTVVSRWVALAGVKVPRFRFVPSTGRTELETAAPPAANEAPPTDSDRPRSGPETWSRKSPFSRAQRAAILAEAERDGQAVVARRHGLARNAISNWMRRSGATSAKSGNPEPRQVSVTPPDEPAWSVPPSKQRGYVADTPRNRAMALAVLQGENTLTVSEREGVTRSLVTKTYRELGPVVAKEHGLTWTPAKRGGKAHVRNIRKEPQTPTQLSRPEPETGLRGPKPQRQQRLFDEPEPQRVTASPGYDANAPAWDDAEQARDKAERELMETTLRTALQEREAFKIVLNVLMREKNQ